eukprot:6277436-Prorocentrum_lima.AAC.1
METLHANRVVAAPKPHGGFRPLSAMPCDASWLAPRRVLPIGLCELPLRPDNTPLDPGQEL